MPSKYILLSVDKLERDTIFYFLFTLELIVNKQLLILMLIL